MDRNLRTRMTEMLYGNARQRRWLKIIFALACIVVFCTVYALILPAITMENTTYCGIEAHAHDAACYEQKLICSEEESEEHTHGEGCYEDSLICTLTEHVHEDACFVDPNAEEAIADDETAVSEDIEEDVEVIISDETEVLDENEESPSLTVREQEEVDAVMEMIAELPDMDTVEQTLAEYEEAEAMSDYENYYYYIGQSGRAAYEAYDDLDEEQQKAVTNSDRLFDLEWLWSAVTLIDEINSDTPTTVAAASTKDFIDLNLYDYGSNINTLYNGNKKYPGFQWNGGAYLKGTYDRHAVDYIDFGNSMITDFDYGSYDGTNGYSENRQMIARSDENNGAINKIDVSDFGVTNRPIGLSLGSSITDKSEDVLSRTLGNDGYPALSDGTSLSYLFKDGTYADKQNTTSIDGLFQQDDTTGQYHYNSRENHAQYSNNQFTLYNQIITPNFIVYPFGNFLPLNSITDEASSTQVGKITSIKTYIQTIINDLLAGSEDGTESQLIDMLARYRNDLRDNEGVWDSWTAKNAIVDYFTGDADNPSDDTSLITNSLLNKMYNIDYDVDTNFFFGMDMTMNFMQPKNGMTGKDTDNDGMNDYPMEFYFTGDDDVWVYLDDVLFLDLSGIHRHVGGQIDYVNGLVHYYYLDSKNTGDVSGTPYKSYTFEEILTAAGQSTDGLQNVVDSRGNQRYIKLVDGRTIAAKTFKDYSTHEFKFYYMERGSGSSVCRMNFNFPLLKKNTITVGKDVSGDEGVLGGAEYEFQVLKANSNGTKTNTPLIGSGVTYRIYNEDPAMMDSAEVDNTENYTTAVTGANGVFKLKKGQYAMFTDIVENSGKYYVRELFDAEAFKQYGTVTVDGTATTVVNGVTVNDVAFTGMDSAVKDATHGSTHFSFNNNVTLNQTGSLEISKVLDALDYSDAADKTFTFDVTIGGEPIPEGTAYTVNGAAATVEIEGQITLEAGEKAVIPKILLGTSFTVKETEASAEGYTVTYTGSEGVTTDGNGASGVIQKAGSTAAITVTNAEEGTTIDIPVEKALTNSDGSNHTYKFKLQQVNAGGTLSDKGETSISAPAETQSKFTIAYLNPELKLKNGESKQFTYQITEIDEGGNATKYDSKVYQVDVTVSKANGALSAEITSIKKNGEAADAVKFTNTLIGDLSLEKQARGLAEKQTYDFTITLKEKDGETPIAGTFVMTKQTGNTDAVTEEITFSEAGEANLTLSHDQKIVIKGLDVGTIWTIKENDPTGQYYATYTVDGEEGKADDQTDTDKEATGEIHAAGSEVSVVFNNTSAYALPLTGGEGTTRYMIGGICLMLSALILYTIYRKRRVEE